MDKEQERALQLATEAGHILLESEKEKALVSVG